MVNCQPFVSFILSAALVLTSLAQSPPPEAAAPNLTEMAAKLPALGREGERKLSAGDTQGATKDFQQASEWAEQLTKTYPQEPAYAENLFYYLNRLGASYAAAGQVQDAVNIQKPVADGYRELANANPSAAARNKAAIAQEHLAWYQILNRDAAGALVSAQQGAALDPAAPSVKLKLAHALLLTGKVDEAKGIYQAQRATPLQDGRTFEQAARDDFAQMEKAGIQNSNIAAIRVLYGARQPGAMRIGLIVLIVGGIFALIAALVIWFLMLERKRAQKLEALTKSLGLTFRKKPTAEDKQLLANTNLRTQGQSGTFSNVVEVPASEDTRITLFDYSYMTGHGDKRRTTMQTVARMQSGLLNLPAFSLRPESLLSKAFKLVGFTDINFLEHPDFSKKYLLGGQDEAAVRQLFTPAIVEYCEQHPRLVIEGSDDRLIVYRQGVRAKPEALEGFLNEANTLLALFVQANRAASSS